MPTPGRSSPISRLHSVHCAVLKAAVGAAHPSTKGGLPERIYGRCPQWLTRKEMPALDDEFPSIGDAEVQDRRRHDQKVSIRVGGISNGTAFDLHLAFRSDGRIG